MAFRTVGAVGLRVRPDTTNFHRELQSKIRAEKDIVVEVPVDPQSITKVALEKVVSEANAKVRESGLRVRLPVTLGDDRLLTDVKARVDEINARVSKNNIAIKVPVELTTRGLATAVANAIREGQRDAKRAGNIDLQTDVNTEATSQKIDHFVRSQSGKNVELDLDVDKSGKARAEIALITRPRDISLRLRIEKRSLADVTGALAGLTGLNLVKEQARTVEHFIKNIDEYAASVGKLGVIFGNLANIGGVGVGGLATLAGNIGAIGGAALGLPAAAAAFASFVTVGIAVFKNFGRAVKGSNDALTQLPKQAQAAVLSLRGTWTRLTDDIQQRFWSGMGTSLQDFVHTSLDSISGGLAKVGGAAGQFTSSFLDQLSSTAKSGVFDRMFGNLATGLHNAAAGAGPLAAAIQRIGDQSSQFIPKIGTYFANALTQFNRWVQKSADSGKITSWMQGAATNAGLLKDTLKDAGGAAVAVVKTFHNAGFGGLATLRTDMGKIRDAVESPGFQDAMSTLFAGARDGAKQLAQALGPLGAALDTLAPTLAGIMRDAGQIAGNLISTIADAIQSPVFGSGLTNLFNGLKTGLANFSKFIGPIVNSLGNLASISGGVFANVLPVVGQFFATLGNTLGPLVTPLQNVSGALSGSLSRGITLVGEAANLAAGPIGTLLDLFAKLPTQIQDAALAIFGIRKLTGASSLRNSLKSAFSSAFTDIGTVNIEPALDVGPATIGKIRGAGTALVGRIGGLKMPISIDDAEIIRAQAAFGRETAHWTITPHVTPFLDFADMTGWTQQASESIARAVDENTARGLTGPSESILTHAFDQTAASLNAKMPGFIGSINRGFDGLKQIGTGAFDAIGKAGGSLLSFLGGPWGVVMIGAAAVMSSFADDAQRTATNLQNAATAAQNLANARFANPLNPNNNDAAQAAALQQAQDLIAKANAAGVNLANFNLSTGGIINAILGQADPQTLKGLQDLQRLAASNGSSSIFRSLAGFVTGGGAAAADSAKKFADLNETLLGVQGTADAAAKDFQDKMTTVADVTAYNHNSAAAAIAEWGVITLKTVPQIFKAISPAGPGGVVDAAANNIHSMAEIMAETLGTGNAAQVANNAALIASGLAQVGDSAQNIADFMSVDGFSNHEIEKVLEGLGFSAADAGAAIANSLDPALQAMNNGVQVAGRNAPAMQSAAQGISNIASAISDTVFNKNGSVKQLGLDLGRVTTALKEFGTSAGGITKGLHGQGFTTSQIVTALGVIGLTAAQAQTAVTDMQRALDREMAPGSIPTKAADDFSQALQDIHDKAEDAATGASDLLLAIDQLNGNPIATGRLMVSFNQAIQSLGKDLTDLQTQKGIDWHKVFNKDGSLNFANQVTQTLFTDLDKISTEALSTATQVADNALASGKTSAQAYTAAKNAVQGQIDGVVKLLQAMHFTQPQIQTLLNMFHLWPDTLATNAVFHGAAAKSSLQDVLNKINNIPAGKTINVGVLDKNAVTTLRGLGLGVHQLSDHTWTVTTSANTTKARSQIDNLQSYINRKRLSAEIAATLRITRTVSPVGTTIRLPNGSLIEANGGIVRSIGGRMVQAFANGGIVPPKIRAFANGESHLAGVFRGIRVFAEPETGGEAYIPLSPLKRERSTAVLTEVAREFGYQLVSSNRGLLKNVQSFGDGGSSVVATPGSPVFYINSVNNPVAEPLTRTAARQARLASTIGP